ncbi:hypothetical protein [Oceanobacter kriegii]|uniref:hypothetical protein n=1 Tax=Oceanobacter kriegii TaxID=64972 RepID=UPI000409755F|nr:hypothetical protein [Oceanobacter kriegii]
MSRPTYRPMAARAARTPAMAAPRFAQSKESHDKTIKEAVNTPQPTATEQASATPAANPANQPIQRNV